MNKYIIRRGRQFPSLWYVHYPLSFMVPMAFQAFEEARSYVWEQIYRDKVALYQLKERADA